MKNGTNDFNFYLNSVGVPFLTRKENFTPAYKDGTPQQPQVIKQVRVNIFNLWESKDLDAYQRIWDAVGYGVAGVAAEERQWVAEHKNWTVFVRWYANGRMDPAEVKDIRLDALADLLKREDKNGKKR